MRLVEGDIMEQKVAKVPSGVDRGRCTFMVGDACNMPALKLGKFDAGADNLLSLRCVVIMQEACVARTP